jgi:glycosyltransferase involved in cell wall biosynthesis
MARIAIISKYPPIEGGISSKTFWLARALAEHGHEIHILTDRLRIDPEYSFQPYEDITDTKNLFVHRASTEFPWHIPNNNHFDLDLLNTAVQVIKETNAEVIDSGYLIPYGIVAYLASQMTSVPFVLRHGGSDIEKFLNKGAFSGLLKAAFQKASLVITDQRNYSKICQLSDRVVVIPPYIPNPHFFNPSPEVQTGKPILALIGKTNYHWRHKGWHRAVNIMKLLKDEFRFMIVSQGIGFEDFKRYAEERLNDASITWRSFVHPLEMPGLFNTVIGVFALFEELPFPAFSNLVLETLWCGKAIITDHPDILRFYENEGVSIKPFSSKIIQLPAKESEQSAGIVSDYFKRRGQIIGKKVDYGDNYNSYFSLNEKAILSVIQKEKPIL